jgi:hypothetical protein
MNNLIVNLNLIISENSKTQILVNKVGLDLNTANHLYRIAGKLSVFIANKIINYYFEYLNKKYSNINKEFVIDYLTNDEVFYTEQDSIRDIIEYIKIELNGNIEPIKNKNYEQIQQEAYNWKKFIADGRGSINYVETHNIILDFRNPDGMGFYWVDLETTKSYEECLRLKHCGEGAMNENLYSLRENIIMSEKYSVNKSYITMGLLNGYLTEMKSNYNQKPKDFLSKYIIPIFNYKNSSGFLIKELSNNVKKYLPIDVVNYLLINRKELLS